MAFDSRKPCHHPHFDKIPVYRLHLDATFLKEWNKSETAEDQMRLVIHNLIIEIEARDAVFISDKTLSKSEAFKNKICSADTRKKGNIQLTKRNYKKALELYTHSIACAPIGSGELALAYGNRSAVLKTIGKFADCIEDVQRALSLDYPELQSYKLILREGQCHRDLGQAESAAQCFLRAEELLDTNFPSKTKRTEELKFLRKESKKKPASATSCPLATLPEIPALSHGSSDEAPSASSAVKIEYSKRFGRHLVATRDIDTGDVLAVEEPFCAVLNLNCWYTHCTHCLLRCDTLLPCDTCAWTMFCSRECQELAMNSYHRAECDAVVKYASRFPIEYLENLLFYIRFIATLGMDQLIASLDTPATPNTDGNQARRTRGFNPDGKFVPGFDAFFSLTHHINQSVEILIKQCRHAVTLLKLFDVRLDVNYVTPLASLVYKLLRTLINNGHTIADMQIIGAPLAINTKFDNLGFALYMTQSLVNHSCAPNIFGSYSRRCKVLRALRPIKKGSQLCESYGPMITTSRRVERQMRLKESHNFVCMCLACSSWPDFTNLPYFPTFTTNEQQIERELLGMLVMMDKKNQDSELLDNSDVDLFETSLSILVILGKLDNQLFVLTQGLVEMYYWAKGNCYCLPK